MKTISDYTIYCTHEQTKKALELGAPIDISKYDSTIINTAITLDGFAIIPTAEQMICWLEEKGIWEVHIYHKWGYTGWCFNLYDSFGNDIVFDEQIYHSRKESILAAIDAALDYLIEKRNETVDNRNRFLL